MKKSILLRTSVLVFICLFLFSCSKFEEKDKQGELTKFDFQAYVGKQGFFENYVNIHDFKNVTFEDSQTTLKHKSALKKLLDYGFTFPNNYNMDSYWEMGEKIFRLQKSKYNDYYQSRYNKGQNNVLIEVFVKERLFNNEVKYEVLTPLQAHNIMNFYDRSSNSFYKNDVLYHKWYLDKEDYSRLTGINEKIFDDLRVVYRVRDYSYDIAHFLFYQMPYKDNYLDYQNMLINRTYLSGLKPYFQKGAIIFIYDKDVSTLQDENVSLVAKKWGHMMIISDYYLDEITNQYKDINQYKKLTNKQEFEDLFFFKNESIYSPVSFYDFMKHFVFIEAMPDSKEDINDNRKFGFGQSGVRRTSGNDKRIQDYFKRATCVAICSLNEGYKLSHPDLIPNVLERCQSHLGKPYNALAHCYHNEDIPRYCSGLVYDAFCNNNQKPSLQLTLMEKHSKIIHNNLNNIPNYCYQIMMPRTICNSPFFKTRIWFKN